MTWQRTKTPQGDDPDTCFHEFFLTPRSIGRQNVRAAAHRPRTHAPMQPAARAAQRDAGSGETLTVRS